MKIHIGTDHAGYVLKEKLVAFLKAQGHEVVDHGATSYNELDDFPDFTIPVAEAVSKDPENSRGIILGATGEPESITANKFPHVRGVVFYGQIVAVVDDNTDILVRSRQHNDTNVLLLGARFLTEDTMMAAVNAWLTTPFGGEEKHKRRIAKIDAIKIHN